MTTVMNAVREKLELAEKRLAAKQYKEMHAATIDAVKLDPTHPRPYFLLGVLAADHDNFNKALELLDRSIAFGPSAEAHAMRARCFVAISKPDAARAALDAAAALNPSDAHTLDTIGVAYTHIGDHQRAISFFTRAVDLDGANVSYLYNLATSQQFSGDLADAAGTYKRLLTCTPDDPRALSALVQMQKQTASQNRLEQLISVFETLDSNNDAEASLLIGHAVAKTYEDLGAYQDSLAWLGKAKAAKRKTVGYTFDNDAPLFAAARQTMLDDERSEAGFSSTEPIFIFGMPRTGTTLVDRILSSHPDVTSAGELSQFSLAVKRLSKTPSPHVLDKETLEAGASIDPAVLGETYIDATRPLTGATRFFTDKMPLNFFYARLIQRALPDARIVCVTRDPLDTCFSNYRQLFATSFTYYVYNLDLVETARYVSAFHQLTELWREKLPSDRFTTVSYESVISDQEGETRRLLSFCGLDWNDACLDFHKNAAPVATASASQVRKPLYSTSVGQWKRYGAAADALKPYFD